MLGSKLPLGQQISVSKGMETLLAAAKSWQLKRLKMVKKFPKNNFNFSFFWGIFFWMYQSILSMYAMFQGFFVVREGSNFFLNIVI